MRGIRPQSDRTDERADKERGLEAVRIIARAIAFAGVAIALALLITRTDGSDPKELHERTQNEAQTGDRADVESALTSTALAQESFFTDTETYAPTVEDLQGAGLDYDPDVVVNIQQVDNEDYCLEATHVDIVNSYWSYDSAVGEIREQPCS